MYLARKVIIMTVPVVYPFALKVMFMTVPVVCLGINGCLKYERD